MEVTPAVIRSVQFREKLRGYHPDDVDAFVAAVAEGVEVLEAKLHAIEARLAEAESRTDATSDAEDSLRRTLVLAQRTADLAIQEARAEAAQLSAETAETRERAEVETAEIKARLRSEVEDEEGTLRQQLSEQRAALQHDVEALEHHLARERERLRIYFSDQLRRVDQGDPSVAPAPEMEAPPDVEEAPSVHDDQPDQATGVYDQGGAATEHDNGDVLDSEPGEGDAPSPELDGEDAFLAELRRAVSDDQPLGPREDEPAPGSGGDDEDGFDLFARNDDDANRFGSRLRRRR